ncbi:PilN domain-containing protein [Nitrogeniibacter mangrovi]|uniref:PilN domain-containing protein n=1 Tax=Nitrogeniibacter mangrovi TaxID=2016596 RepID=A0A6C1B7P7_9RHOO|nr:hypothetical protein [Nitrogeniibacter mangrovi]QID19393.1 PilN domain-containing protein [Nitrogeniibacter mangrovi]
MFQMVLPRSARPHFRSAVGYLLLRESPLDPSMIEFDVGAPQLSRVPEHIQVPVALCRTSDLDTAIHVTERLGLSVRAVGSSPIDKQRFRWVFRRPQRKRVSTRLLEPSRLLVGCVCSFVVVTLAGSLIADSMSAQIRERERRLVLKLGAHADELERQTLQRETLAAVASEFPRFRLTSLLNEIAAALPADARVDQIEFADGALTIGGFAPEPGRAIAEMKRHAPELSGFRLESVTANPNPGEQPQFRARLRLLAETKP